MQIAHFIVLYLAIGVGCALLLRRRRAIDSSAIDALLTVIAWPVYAPVMLDPSASGRADNGHRARVDREQGALIAAIQSVTDPALSILLPSADQIVRVAEHLRSLDAKVGELDALLAHGETSISHAEGALADAEKEGVGVDDARRLLESVRRLVALRDGAARERDELFAACARLRAHVLVVRYSGVASEDIRALVAEIVGRVEDAETFQAANAP